MGILWWLMGKGKWAPKGIIFMLILCFLHRSLVVMLWERYQFLRWLCKMMKAYWEMALPLMWWPWSTSPPHSILIVDVGRMGFLQMCFFGTCWHAVVVFDWLFVCHHAAVKKGWPPLNWVDRLCDGEGVPGLRNYPRTVDHEQSKDTWVGQRKPPGWPWCDATTAALDGPVSVWGISY